MILCHGLHSTGIRGILTYFENVWGLWRWVPRYALGQAIAGIPGFEGLSRLSMANFQRILRDYGVVEFFWFVSDGIGHYKGIEAQKSSVIHFDSMLTPLVRYVENSPDSLNVVLYCDHGMSMTESLCLRKKLWRRWQGTGRFFVPTPTFILWTRVMPLRWRRLLRTGAS